MPCPLFEVTYYGRYGLTQEIPFLNFSYIFTKLCTSFIFSNATSGRTKTGRDIFGKFRVIVKLLKSPVGMYC